MPPPRNFWFRSTWNKPSFRKPCNGCPESIRPVVVMDSGPAPRGASRNDGREKRRATLFRTATLPSRRALPAHHDLLVQLLIHDLHRAVDLGIGLAELMRNQFHQQVDPLDEGRAAGDCAGGRGR